MWSIHWLIDWLIDWLIASFATRSVWTRTHRHQSPTRMERSVSPLRPLDISRPSIFTQWSAVAVSPLLLNVVLYAFHEQYYQQANCALVSLHSVLAVVFWLLYVQCCYASVLLWLFILFYRLCKCDQILRMCLRFISLLLPFLTSAIMCPFVSLCSMCILMSYHFYFPVPQSSIISLIYS